MQIAIHDARGERRDLPHVIAHHVEPRMARQPLRDRHDRHENDRGEQGRDQQNARD